MGFQRARSAEQREERRRAILDAATAMLRDTPVADLTLTALAQRAGLAKSAVLRYFDSREAVLLELLDAEWAGWLDDLGDELRALPGGDERTRVGQVAAALTRTLLARPALCELGAAQASVLERNVSPEVAARFKRASLRSIGTLAELLRAGLPELAPEAAFHAAGGAAVVTAAFWAQCRPSPAMEAAYAADPQLAALRLDFGDVVREMLEVLLLGYLAR